MFAMSFIFVNFIIAESGVGMWAMVLSEGNRSARAGRHAPKKDLSPSIGERSFLGGPGKGLQVFVSCRQSGCCCVEVATSSKRSALALPGIVGAL